MALHIFNLSIDTPDAQPDIIPEDLSVNDIESVAELILEDVLLIDNAVPESDEQDTDDGCELEFKKVEFFSHNLEVVPFYQPASCFFDFPSLCEESFLPAQYFEITTPPPQA